MKPRSRRLRVNFLDPETVMPSDVYFRNAFSRWTEYFQGSSGQGLMKYLFNSKQRRTEKGVHQLINLAFVPHTNFPHFDHLQKNYPSSALDRLN
jgi:hypothetical protein